MSTKEAEINAITKVFRSHRVRAKVVARRLTPGVILYGILKHDQERIKRIENVMPEVELELSRVRTDDISGMVRFGYPPIVIEIPRPDPQIITWPDELPNGPHAALVGRGYSIKGATDQIVRFDESPHVLIASITGGGKSILEVGMALSMAMKTPPRECRFVLVDLKNRALVPLRKLPHVDRFAHNDAEAVAAVQYVYDEVMQRRATYGDPSTRLMLIIDELAQMPSDAKPLLSSITALGRELKVNVLAATQYPTAKVLGGGDGKTNYTTSLAGRVKDATSANIATGIAGSNAHLLPGKGEFLRVDEHGTHRFRAYMLTSQQITRATRYICQKWNGSASAMVQRSSPQTHQVDPLDAVFDQYHDGNGGLRRGGIMAAIRAMYGASAADGGRRHQEQKAVVLEAFHAWNEKPPDSLPGTFPEPSAEGFHQW